MYPLNDSYKAELDAIAEELQASETFSQYLEEEEEEFYNTLRETYEPRIAKIYNTVAEDNPLQLVALEKHLLEEKFEGLFLPKILGYAVLRGEVNEHIKYARPQDHFQAILSAICRSSNFDIIKKRIGQTIQMGFALSSDIRITNLINTFDNKKIRYFLQSQKLPRYRDPRERKAGHFRYNNQFKNENFYCAEFPTNKTGLKLDFSALKTFLLYRVENVHNNTSITPEIQKFLANDQVKDTPEYVEMLSIYAHFFNVEGSDFEMLKKQFNESRKSFADFEEVWWAFVLEIQAGNIGINAEADARVFKLLDNSISDNLTPYYQLVDVIHSKGYSHPDSVEAMRAFYGNHPGLSDINEAARQTILNYLGNFLKNISEEEYSEYFELSKVFPVYTELFSNQHFNQALKIKCLTYIKRLLKRFTDKRGRDYQDIKKFVVTSFTDLGFMKPKELVELFKTKRKKKAPVS